MGLESNYICIDLLVFGTPMLTLNIANWGEWNSGFDQHVLSR